ncbi:MAG: hypothetical protein GF317_15415 [Candidatus Lokiarchaeota archaeon]|nr:hypothetical protein [Candidatus Lokiarchaeota archaeon]MBD3200954.1 hypothetical protein [Candidatus Lokiarchaeota archaeon]
MIHNILILKRSGEKLFNRSYSEIAWNEILTSGFISALFNFTQELFSADIQDLELGPYKLLFESEKNDDLIICAIFDKIDSIINVRQNLINLKERLLENYSEKLKNEILYEDDFSGMGQITDEIVSSGVNSDISEGLRKRYVEILEDFRANSEILDCDLISGSGVPLQKEWNKDFLELCLRQIDAFWKVSKYMLDQIIISYQQRHLILYKINENLVLSSLIRRNTPLGLATLLIEDVANKLMKINN